MFKKSLYIFLTALMGVMLFVLLDRLVVFFYLFLLTYGYTATDMAYQQIQALDYFVLTLVMMGGAWYGIWVGLYWYSKVYEEKSHKGFVDHVATNYFPGNKPKIIHAEMSAVKERLQSDLWQLEDLSQQEALTEMPLAEVKPKTVRKRVVKRKTAPRPKIKTTSESGNDGS